MLHPHFATALILMLTLFIFTGCRKDDDPEPPKVYQEESPMQGFLSTIGYNTQYTKINDFVAWNLGLNFTPLVKGKINGVKVKLPAANPALKVTIWDAASGTNIRTETVNVAAASTLYTFTFSPVELEKDKKYIISFLSDDFYGYKKSNSADGAFPVTVGNIRIDKTSYKSAGTGTNPVFPAESESYTAYGDLDMIFQQIP